VHVVTLGGKRLQGLVVGGNRDRGPPLDQRPHDGAGQRGAGFRISRARELVEQHEHALTSLLEHAPQRDQVRGERR
jgi:hypothetical protein